MTDAPTPAIDRPLILASQSEVRLSILRAAGLRVTARPARIDEVAFRDALLAEGAHARDIADALAEMKARRCAAPGALVLGCDQVLETGGVVWGKPDSPAEALEQLRGLAGKTHRLLSAMVLFDGAEPVWRHVGTASLTMRRMSEAWLGSYVGRNWDSIRHSLGGYKLEEEGIRLFSAIEGDGFTIRGLPIIPLLDYLGLRGFIAA